MSFDRGRDRLQHMRVGRHDGVARCATGRSGQWSVWLRAPPATWREVVASFDDEPADWRTDARIGGFPTPAVHLTRERERTIWFDGYVRTYLERDLQVLASISALPDFRRLMTAAAARVGQMLNQTELGRDIGLSQPTIHRWLNLLETSYMIVRLPAFAINRTKRLIKSPKLYFGDCGVALHLLGGEPTGAHLENLLLLDLLAWRDARLERAEVCYWRTATGEEVDFVVETRAGLLPIEVKSSGRPRLADTVALRSFRAEYGAKALPGLLVHTGTTLEWLADDVLAVPWWRIV